MYCAIALIFYKPLIEMCMEHLLAKGNFYRIGNYKFDLDIVNRIIHNGY